jgi:glutamate dehydrogenase/leucine dehydrogenase
MKQKITTVIKMLFGMSLGYAGGTIINKKVVAKQKKQIDKFKSYYKILNQWMIFLHQDKSLDQYFIQRKYKRIAIYGMGELGNRLYEELENSSVEIVYVIDQEASSIFVEAEAKEPDEVLEEVDVIIVTAVFDFDKISEELGSKISCPVISLEEVIEEL